MDLSKHRLRSKEPNPRGTDLIARILRILIGDLDRLASPSRSRRVGHQLRVTALFQRNEPVDGFLDGLADGQQSVVL